MKKRVISLALVLSLTLGMMLSVNTVQASDERLMIDGSVLTYEDESIGYDTKITRGIYLLTGYSKGVELGANLFYAGGSTVATQTVDRVGVDVFVERAQEGDDSWDYVDSWSARNDNADRVSSNRRMNVEGGYYYRVRSYHYANDEVSTSSTDGVYVREQ